MEERNFPELSDELMQQWLAVKPSNDRGRILYRPCKVTLKNGEEVECVYVIEAQKYIDWWGVWPDKDEGKKEIKISEVVRIEESLHRLPPDIANKIYHAGESGMGYCIFSLIFSDGYRQAVVSGNAVDFVRLPNGKKQSEIVDVEPHEGINDQSRYNSLDYHWCLFGKGISRF